MLECQRGRNMGKYWGSFICINLYGSTWVQYMINIIANSLESQLRLLRWIIGIWYILKTKKPRPRLQTTLMVQPILDQVYHLSYVSYWNPSWGLEHIPKNVWIWMLLIIIFSSDGIGHKLYWLLLFQEC